MKIEDRQNTVSTRVRDYFLACYRYVLSLLFSINFFLKLKTLNKKEKPKVID